MFGPSFKIAAVWGIPIKLDLSIILTLAIILMEYGKRRSRFALLFAVGLFGSIALHELGHAYVARLKRCRVRRIVLTCIGGVAEMENMPRRPFDEFLMAAAGPAVSLLLCGACFAGAVWAPPTDLRDLLVILGVVNRLLLVFNLLPAFPMDGGRILRSILTPRMGRLKATRFAARLGKILAVASGLLALWAGYPFTVVIAVFIYLGARREYRLVQIEDAMGRHGFGMWSPPQPMSDDSPPDSGDNSGQATISPPPYRGGPASKTPICADKDGPLNLFDR
ncbi:MAG: site-2 protease family protein [Verrucomicrobiota bacterium]|nr:site-2 protease family protein [Verrucomicrobiota bacterium]